jgi:hypothetical protein
MTRNNRMGSKREFWIAGAAVMIAVASLTAAPVHACTCASVRPSLASSMQAADVIFEGVARGPWTMTAMTIDNGLGPEALSQTFEVLRRWKGEVPATVAILTPARGGSCGRTFSDGANYVVYARRQANGVLWDELCSRSIGLDRAEEDLAALGDGLPPSPAPVVAGGESGGCAVTGDRVGGGGSAGGRALGLALVLLAGWRSRVLQRARRHAGRKAPVPLTIGGSSSARM